MGAIKKSNLRSGFIWIDLILRLIGKDQNGPVSNQAEIININITDTIKANSACFRVFFKKLSSMKYPYSFERSISKRILNGK